MGRRFSVETVFTAVDKFVGPVSRMQTRMKRFTRSMTLGLRKVNRGADKLLGGFKRFALGATLALGIVGTAMADVISVGATFDQTLVNAAAKFPGEVRKGTQSFTELSDAARKVGRTTEFTATQGAEALNFLALAGFDAKASIAALPGVVDLATAAQVDLGTATDIATDSLGAFNLLSKDAGVQQANLARVSDILVATSTRANTTIEDMFESLKAGAPIATAAGQSIETTAALIATMANAGIKGSRSGTGLKNIMLAISAPTGKAAKVFRELGVELQTSSGGVRDAIDVFTDIAAATKDLGDAKTLASFEKIFGKIPIAGAINIANAADATREFRDSLKDTSGVATEMASVMRDTVQGRLNSLKSAVESVKISIFTMNEGPLADVIDNMTEWVRTNEEFIASGVTGFLAKIANNFESIVKWGKRIGGTLVVVGGLILLLKAFVLVMTAVNIVMALNPIVLIVAGVVALVGALVAAIVWWDKLRVAILELPGPVKTAIALMIAPTVLLARAAKMVIDHWEPIKAFFKSLFDDAVALGSKITGIAGKILDPFGLAKSGRGKVGGFLKGVGGFAADKLGGFTENILGGGADDGSPQVVSPQERVARSIEENRTTDSMEVTLRAGPGTSAEVTQAPKGGGLRLEPSGAF